MTTPLFLRNVIAVIWDFDETLIPGYMQGPIFRYFHVDEAKFWREVDALPEYYAKQRITVSRDTLYLNHMLTYVEDGYFKGLNNALLRELGGQLTFFPGLPDFLEGLRRTIKDDPEFKKHEIRVEHYVVSTGLRQMILGSKVAKYMDEVWGCEFIERPAGAGYVPLQREMTLIAGAEAGGAKKTPKRRKAAVGPPVIKQLGYVLDNTTKTRAVFEINKGTNKDASIGVNASIREEDRRVPFQNMIYVADGPSDIPVFSIINRFAGKTYAVYPAGSEAHFAKVYDLKEQERVQGFGEANYEPGSQTYMWITHSAKEIARRIVEDRRLALRERVAAPPGHIIEYPAAPESEGTEVQSEIKKE